MNVNWIYVTLTHCALTLSVRLGAHADLAILEMAELVLVGTRNKNDCLTETHRVFQNG